MQSTVRVLAAMLMFAASARAQVIARTTVDSVYGANALSTPAARHLVRTDGATWLLALQRDGALPNPGLSLYRSEDDGDTWSFLQAINPSPLERHTADVLRVGADVALVHSFDGPSLAPDAALDPTRKVWFQWWRADGKGSFVGQAPVPVFDPVSGVAYHRAELAIDSLGRIWVQAFKRGPASCDPLVDPRCATCNRVNGDNYANEMVVSVSGDGGRTFSPEQPLQKTLCRAGGRLLDLGKKLFLIWNDYSANEHGTRIVTRFMQRDAGDPIEAWSAPEDAFPDFPADGIYHGAALSAVADGAGGMHLVYKDQSDQMLWYRRFDGQGFGPPLLVDDSKGDWALQPAAMLQGTELYILANHALSATAYETRMWKLSEGLGPDRATALEVDDAFHGYPTLPETMPRGAESMPYVYGRTEAADLGGEAISLRLAIGPPRATLAASPSTPLTGGSASSVITLMPWSGFRGSVPLSISGQPPGSTAVLVESTLTAGAGTTRTTLMLTPGAAEDGAYRVSVTGDAGGTPISVEVPWVIARNAAVGRDKAASQSGGCASGPGAAQAVALVAAALASLARRRRRIRRVSHQCRNDLRPNDLRPS